MSRYCVVTKKKVMFGNNVSHANNRTRRRFLPNIQNVSLRSDILDKSFHMKLSTRGLRTLEFHGGLDGYLLTTKNSKLDLELLKIKRQIKKAQAS